MNYFYHLSRPLLPAALLLFLVASVSAQSTSQDFPTPITTNEISGTILARDVGDSRLTAYYYHFEGGQGDIFVNLVTKNFTGDIDFFIQNGLQPLSKIVVYSDYAETETGRVFYLRKPEKMLVRIQGRTPNDDPAEFRVKFAGSFIAVIDTGEAQGVPKVTAQNTGRIRVNSVGTIIEVLPKPTHALKEVTKVDETIEKKTAEEKTEAEKVEVAEAEKVSEAEKEIAGDKEIVDKEVIAADKKIDPEKPKADETKPEVVVTDELAKTIEKTVAESKEINDPYNEGSVENKTVEDKPKESKSKKPAKGKSQKRSEPEVPNLENIRLVILFKDGKMIERPMNEVFKFSIDKGILTVISTDGRIGRYSMVDVAKVTIE